MLSLVCINAEGCLDPGGWNIVNSFGVLMVEAICNNSSFLIQRATAGLREVYIVHPASLCEGWARLPQRLLS